MCVMGGKGRCEVQCVVCGLCGCSRLCAPWELSQVCVCCVCGHKRAGGGGRARSAGVREEGAGRACTRCAKQTVPGRVRRGDLVVRFGLNLQEGRSLALQG